MLIERGNCMGRIVDAVLKNSLDGEKRPGVLRNLTMALREFKAKANSWLRTHKLSGVEAYQPQVDDQGLISEDAGLAAPAENEQTTVETNKVVVKAAQPMNKHESLEKLQNGFNKLVEQLRGINEHLDRQVVQQEDLMSRIDNMPKLLETFPTVVENQKQLIEQLLEHLKTTAARNQQFIDAVEKIPTATAKQTDALADIDHQLAAVADTDVQMAESFNSFNGTLDKLNQSTISQTDGIMQMSKTFATSDRYLKYIISRQNKRFMWMFLTAVGVCVSAILILAGIVIYLGQ